MKLLDEPLFASTLLPTTVIFVFSSEKLVVSEFIPHTQSSAPFLLSPLPVLNYIVGMRES